MSKNSLMRIARNDMRSVEKMDLASLGIHVHFQEDDITKAVAIIIGPPGTPYEDGILFFRIRFPQNYPFSPPKVTYVSSSRIRIHPNLYVGKAVSNYEGKVCLSVLNTWSGPKWTSVMNVSSVLITLQSVLDENPLRNEPGYEKIGGEINDVYNLLVQHDTLKTLIIQNGLSPDSPFQDMTAFRKVIIPHLIASLQRIHDKAYKLATEHPAKKTYSMGTYHIKSTIDFPSLHELLLNSG